MEEKNEVNENKKMLGDFSCTMDQMDTDGENKTQIFYRCCSNYALWKIIVDIGIEDIWRRETQYSPELPRYNRSFVIDPE